MSNNCKVKGLLKGLRFISQIFENEKEQEIQIGNPTDVKHVAHIGWQGPTEDSPSWMNEYKGVPGLSSSAPLNLNGDIHSDGPDNSVKWVSEDSIRRGSRSTKSQGEEKDLPELPKSSRRQSMGNLRESHSKEKSDRARQPKKPSKDGSNRGPRPNEAQSMSTDSDYLQTQGNNSSSDLQPRSRTLPDIPKRSRSNRSKDGSNGGSGSTRSRARAQHRDPSLNEEVDPSRSSSKSRNKQSQRSFEEVVEDGQLQRRSSKDLLTN